MGMYLTRMVDGVVKKFKVAGNSGISHPVGSIYMSTENTSPASLFGGTWEQIKDTFLLSAGDTYSAGATGGEATHTLTVDEMPSHSHAERWPGYDGNIYTYNLSYGSGGSLWGINANMISVPRAANTATTNLLLSADKGGSQPHNNMPPYLVVYCWKRIS